MLCVLCVFLEPAVCERRTIFFKETNSSIQIQWLSSSLPPYPSFSKMENSDVDRFMWEAVFLFT